MAKIKSIKFYNFTQLYSGSCAIFNMQFFNFESKLTILDFSNPISNSATYCETSEYIVTASGTYQNNINLFPGSAFHTGNFNKQCNLNKIGYGAWLAPSSSINEWIKIEFKFPQYISSIKICNAIYNYNDVGFNTCKYDIEYENDIIETYEYNSNGKTSLITYKDFVNYTWNQEVMDSQFDSIEFSKSKQIYDFEIGQIETLDTNNFRNIPINSVKTLKVLYTKPEGTNINCIISFDKKQTWKSFDGDNWIDINDISQENIILNCMSIGMLNTLNKNKLIAGGFTGDLDFKMAMKTNDKNKTPSVTKIYIEYK